MARFHMGSDVASGPSLRSARGRGKGTRHSTGTLAVLSDGRAAATTSFAVMHLHRHFIVAAFVMWSLLSSRLLYVSIHAKS
jgi:hypothetical protein